MNDQNNVYGSSSHGMPAPPPAMSPPPMGEAPPRTSGLATTSMVVGICAAVGTALVLCVPILSPLTIIAGLVGLVLGIIALKSIRKSDGRIGGRGQAITGVATSASSIVLSILLVAVFAALLLPALGKARTMARSLIATGNGETYANAMFYYADEHALKLPDADTWKDDVAPYLAPGDIRDNIEHDFAMNSALSEWNAFDSTSDPSRSPVLLFEVALDSPTAGGKELLPPKPHNGGTYVIIYLDGTSEFVAPEGIDALLWEP